MPAEDFFKVGAAGGAAGASAGAYLASNIANASILGPVGAVVGALVGVVALLGAGDGVKHAEDAWSWGMKMLLERLNKVPNAAKQLALKDVKNWQEHKDLITLEYAKTYPLKYPLEPLLQRVEKKYMLNLDGVSKFLDKAGDVIGKANDVYAKTKAGAAIISDSANKLSQLKDMKSSGGLVTQTSSSPGGGGWVVLVAFGFLAWLFFKR